MRCITKTLDACLAGSVGNNRDAFRLAAEWRAETERGSGIPESTPDATRRPRWRIRRARILPRVPDGAETASSFGGRGDEEETTSGEGAP